MYHDWREELHDRLREIRRKKAARGERAGEAREVSASAAASRERGRDNEQQDLWSVCRS